jgi:hypothetical protein
MSAVALINDRPGQASLPGVQPGPNSFFRLFLGQTDQTVYLSETVIGPTQKNRSGEVGTIPVDLGAKVKNDGFAFLNRPVRGFGMGLAGIGPGGDNRSATSPLDGSRS